jgi:hypothetical protein
MDDYPYATLGTDGWLRCCRYPEDRVPPRTSIKSRLARVPVAPAPASRLGAAPGQPHAPAAPGLQRVTYAPAPTIWLLAALELPRVLRTVSAGRKQINKYPLATRPS